MFGVEIGTLISIVNGIYQIFGSGRSKFDTSAANKIVNPGGPIGNAYVAWLVKHIAYIDDKLESNLKAKTGAFIAEYFRVNYLKMNWDEFFKEYPDLVKNNDTVWSEKAFRRLQVELENERQGRSFGYGSNNAVSNVMEPVADSLNSMLGLNFSWLFYIVAGIVVYLLFFNKKKKGYF